MENGYIDMNVRTRLILAGISELEEHGVRDFSLRRVAQTAQVSCAAPYRHFKDKNSLISGIIEYIVERRELLCKEIETAYAADLRKTVIELAVANLRFWLANPNYRSVLMIPEISSENSDILARFDGGLMRAVDRYLASRGEELLAPSKKYTVRAMIYGTVMLLGCGAEDPEPIMVLLREKLAAEF